MCPSWSSGRPILLLAILFCSLSLAPVAVADEDEFDALDDDAPVVAEYDPLPPDLAWRDAIRLGEVPAAHDGGGVTVAVLDTGLTRVDDLGDRVAARVDLSPERDGYDRYGHGTHMTGLVAGDGGASGGRWAGAAPGASVVSVKVAGWNGATDVSMILAGLEWIAAHRERYGIRVVNLSYGTDSSQKWSEDPLNLAVERLWRAGVLVVVGAGNRGDGGSRIDKPADDPHVLTIGAADTMNTADTADDVVAPFSSRGPTGDGVAKPDVVAPGVNLVSHRAPQSTVDRARPRARIDDVHVKGTGTSQAAAVVSGVAARMIDAAPALTPDEAKEILTRTASAALAGASGAGAGLVDAAAAVEAAQARRFTGAGQDLPLSSGKGSLDSSRGSFKPYTDWKEHGKPEQLSGEADALGRPWASAEWAAQPWSAERWTASEWARHTAVSPGWAAAAPADAWSGLGEDTASWIAKSWGDAGPLDVPPWIAKSWGTAAWNGAP
jgi:serine protease AprX